MKVQSRALPGLFLMPLALTSQVRQLDVAPLKHRAPPYWQLSESERDAASLTPLGQSPAYSLVFAGMTPRRVADTRSGQGFPGAFGPPSLAAGASRTSPVQSSATCTIRSIAQAYSFNIAVAPSTPSGFITAYPTGQPHGSVDVFAHSATDSVIDVNGYYAPQTGVTLAQGSASAPPLSFRASQGRESFRAAEAR